MHELNVEVRKDSGKRAVKALRLRGAVPAVLYGKNLQTEHLAVNEKIFLKMVRERHDTGLVRLNIQDGDQTRIQDAIYQEIHADYIKRRILHVDFHGVLPGEKIHSKVAVVLKGVPVGAIEEGGTLVSGVNEVHILCLPKDLPEEFVVDVSEMHTGDSKYVRDLMLTDIEFRTNPGAMLASVTAPGGTKEEAAPAEGAEAKAPEAKAPAAAAPKAKAKK